ICFMTSDIQREEKVEGEFDALVGRLILMHLVHPAEVLRTLAHHLRPNAVVAFQETIASLIRSYPPAPLAEKVLGWIVEATRRGGADPDFATRLYPTLVEAGFTGVRLRAHQGLGGGPESGFYG